MPARPAAPDCCWTAARRGRSRQLGRRAFVRHGALLLLASSRVPLPAQLEAATESTTPSDRFAVVTDLHYADKDAAGTRHYRRVPAKLAEAAQQLGSFQPGFVVELGDLIDAADTVEMESEFLHTIHRQFQSLPGDKHYVLGNHCVYTLTKGEFLTVVDQQQTYYAFDTQAYHYIVLDACYRDDEQPYGRKNFDWTDSCVPSEELKWLQDDLARSERPTIVFVHQRLDVDDSYGVKNAAAVRETLERSGHVRAVFQGHYHAGDYRDINGIHYVTVRALVEGSGTDDNAYATVEVLPQGSVRVKGFCRQPSYQLGP